MVKCGRAIFEICEHRLKNRRTKETDIVSHTDVARVRQRQLSYLLRYASEQTDKQTDTQTHWLQYFAFVMGAK